MSVLPKYIKKHIICCLFGVICCFLWVNAAEGLVITQPCCHEFAHRGSLFGAELPVQSDSLFSVSLADREKVDQVSGYLKTTNSENVALCSFEKDELDFKDSIVFIPRGGCSFAQKVYFAELLGAKAAIIYQSQEPPKQNRDNVIVMAADARYGPLVTIPSAFVSYETYLQIQALFEELESEHENNPVNKDKVPLFPYIILNETGSLPPSGPDALPMMWDSMMFLLKIFLVIWSFMGAAYFYNWIKIQIRRKRREDVVKMLPCKTYSELFTNGNLADNRSSISVGMGMNPVTRTKSGKRFDLVNTSEERQEGNVENGEEISMKVNNTKKGGYSPVKDQEEDTVVEIPLGKNEIVLSDDGTEGEESEYVDCIECENCVICLCEFEPNDMVTVLPCRHIYHKECIEPWLTSKSALCPMCKQSILPSGDSRSLEEISNAENFSEQHITFEQEQRRTSIALSLGMFMVIVVSLTFMMFDDT
mmetsp:Transcript_5016/g.6533  ORF Transcript_5016/g.6533 Transcript_5016/m.6533 type:complete len:477 (-) Transcript_5016:86-1516(-)|eukprot:CAMPEP_0204830864 /NCGR_PEP_ID=MMETSP1346-20131115/9443_1 /ASSEMBLY_ACC=CAM_ASM_000771 /TAXON_ID=215587 /ORGANISM="Aplanochytrium stocchinoi, Strain GSBS06" /LENGTH=476 /DNA_ID=CAMNT_0051961471 /DNA_START=372 /DNA_END=1802 /DNA_ORIENTATION=-